MAQQQVRTIEFSDGTSKEYPIDIDPQALAADIEREMLRRSNPSATALQQATGISNDRPSGRGMREGIEGVVGQSPLSFLGNQRERAGTGRSNEEMFEAANVAAGFMPQTRLPAATFGFLRNLPILRRVVQGATEALPRALTTSATGGAAASEAGEDVFSRVGFETALDIGSGMLEKTAPFAGAATGARLGGMRSPREVRGVGEAVERLRETQGPFQRALPIGAPGRTEGMRDAASKHIGQIVDESTEAGVKLRSPDLGEAADTVRPRVEGAHLSQGPGRMVDAAMVTKMREVIGFKYGLSPQQLAQVPDDLLQDIFSRLQFTPRELQDFALGQADFGRSVIESGAAGERIAATEGTRQLPAAFSNVTKDVLREGVPGYDAANRQFSDLSTITDANMKMRGGGTMLGGLGHQSIQAAAGAGAGMTSAQLFDTDPLLSSILGLLGFIASPHNVSAGGNLFGSVGSLLPKAARAAPPVTSLYQDRTARRREPR